MEFRLNKIDPEVRQKVNEAASTDKVHNKSNVVINSDNEDNKNKGNWDFGLELEKQRNKKEKKRLFVEAVKVEEVKISAYKEEKGSPSEDEIKGHIIDAKK